MEEISFITDKAQLEGTCYIELSLGKYQMHHWQESSLFFEEEIFGLIEPIFERNIKDYDHYEMNDVNKEQWLLILKDISSFNELLASCHHFNELIGHVGFIFGDSRDYFQTHFIECKEQLYNMNIALIKWIKSNLNQYDHIAVLGI